MQDSVPAGGDKEVAMVRLHQTVDDHVVGLGEDRSENKMEKETLSEGIGTIILDGRTMRSVEVASHQKKG